MKFLKFIINGGIIGFIAFIFQINFFQVLGGISERSYVFASFLTYLPLVALNFYIQKEYIFESSGQPIRFLISNALIMLFVSVISPLCWNFLAIILGPDLGKNLGFICAALIGAVPSFLLSKHFVFGKTVQRK